MNETQTIALLELAGTAIVLVEPPGTVRYISGAARALIAAGQIISVAEGAISLRRKDEDRLLREQIASVADRGGRAMLCLRNREGAPILLIDMLQVRRASERAGAQVGLRLTALAVPQAASTDRLRAVLNLTAAEARVTAALSAGQSITAAAQAQGVEPETVRGQVKSVRSKAGVRSQNQLIAMVAAIGADPALP